MTEAIPVPNVDSPLMSGFVKSCFPSFAFVTTPSREPSAMDLSYACLLQADYVCPFKRKAAVMKARIVLAQHVKTS